MDASTAEHTYDVTAHTAAALWGSASPPYHHRPITPTCLPYAFLEAKRQLHSSSNQMNPDKKSQRLPEWGWDKYLCRINLASSFSLYPYSKPHLKLLLSPFWWQLRPSSPGLLCSQASLHEFYLIKCRRWSPKYSAEHKNVLNMEVFCFFLSQAPLNTHWIIPHTPQFPPQRVKVVAPGRTSQILRTAQEFSILDVSGI